MAGALLLANNLLTEWMVVGRCSCLSCLVINKALTPPQLLNVPFLRPLATPRELWTVLVQDPRPSNEWQLLLNLRQPKCDQSSALIDSPLESDLLMVSLEFGEIAGEGESAENQQKPGSISWSIYWKFASGEEEEEKEKEEEKVEE